jgi:hypothetical protein
MRHLVLVVFFFLSLSGLTQVHPLFLSSGAKSLALANTSSSHADIFSNFNNQAGLAQLKDIEAATFFETRYISSDINTIGVSAALPTKSGVFGFSYKRFGLNDLFVQSSTSLNYGRMLSESFSLGGGFSYLNTFIGNNYGSSGTLAVHLGVMAKLNESLELSAHLSNMNRAKLAEFYNERYPSLLNIGLKYKVSEKVDVITEMSKDISHKPSARGAVEYSLNKSFAFRIGAATNPTLFSFGVGYQKENLTIDVGASLHQVLGITSGITLAYAIKK